MEEERLYNAVSAYLQREESYALPSGQRALMTLVLRKILASSSFAIANTLGSMVHRLETHIARAGGEALPPMTEVLAEDYESIAETQENGSRGDALTMPTKMCPRKTRARHTSGSGGTQAVQDAG